MVEPAPPGLPAPGRRGARPDLLPILTAQATIRQPILCEAWAAWGEHQIAVGSGE